MVIYAVIFGEKKIFNRQTLLLVIVGFFTFGAGYIVALQFGETFSSHDHSTGRSTINGVEIIHNHEPLEITDNIEFDYELN